MSRTPADFARLPAISTLLADPALAGLPHALAARAAREVVAELRAGIRAGEPLPDDIPARVRARVEALRAPVLRRVVNATGIVLHTNLGRSPLAPEAAGAIAEVARGYSNVELDLDSGARGERLVPVRDRLRELTGAEDALVVNNNAAAVLLAVTALARGGEVITSRGELVEIGGSFRVPDVLRQGGARLVGVGTTNRTRARDYAAAIGEDTRILLRVHPSNYRIVGFTERPPRPELVALARERGIPLVEDLGSGLLGPAPRAMTEAEALDESVERAVAEGADLVCFSGDKLLGGPQAGIVVGRAALVGELRRHPLYRALRVDKLILAALEATLRVFAEGRLPPCRALLDREPEALRAVAERLAAAAPGGRVEPAESFTGGGALPARPLPTHVAAWPLPDPEAAARALRQRRPPVLARVARGALIIDPRTLLPGDEAELTAALVAVLGGAEPGAGD